MPNLELMALRSSTAARESRPASISGCVGSTSAPMTSPARPVLPTPRLIFAGLLTGSGVMMLCSAGGPHSPHLKYHWLGPVKSLSKLPVLHKDEQVPAIVRIRSSKSTVEVWSGSSSASTMAEACSKAEDGRTAAKKNCDSRPPAGSDARTEHMPSDRIVRSPMHPQLWPMASEGLCLSSRQVCSHSIKSAPHLTGTPSIGMG